MSSVTQRFGWYLAVLQLFFTLCWTVYAIYFPKLAASAGLAPGAVILLLMLDQAIFTVCDFATGIAADKMTRVIGRLGIWVAAATALSCVAFIALPFVASAGAPLLIAVTLVWTVTSSALRAPPLKLLGKYAAKPSIPLLTSLAMLGHGIASALAPYLAITLRDVDPRVPFSVASIVLVLTTLGMISAERKLASAPQPKAESPPIGAFGTMTTTAIVFALGMIVLALGYQMHVALASGPLYLRFAKTDELPWLMPVFWIGFNVAMFPASIVTKRVGGYAVMGAAALVGALAILATHVAQGLEFLVIAQFAAGAAWGAILMSAFTVAFAIGSNGAEGRMSGLLFSALALATLARMAAVATGVNADPAMKAVLQWTPILCWSLAGAALLYLAIAGLRRWSAQKS
ncbi:MAG: MFS transporter [Pseudolabrys sp.]|nr:MFS transporter [Pseudolabrys sp.]MSP32850.1 MFS transporter [Pseudolabrys sp.]